jgi:hydroxymethylpyrimidine/phosphomethylpyrimidine kinase
MSGGRTLTPLTVAGSDPSGGAGLQADLKVFLAFGLSGAAVPTALTIQGRAAWRGFIPFRRASFRGSLRCCWPT